MAKLIQDLSIGGNLRKLREARGLTQEDVCAGWHSLADPCSSPPIPRSRPGGEICSSAT
mgnify:CR=1 FL=1